jgi:hypothetical protein
MIKSEIKRKFSDETSTGYAEHRYYFTPDFQMSPKTECLVCVQRGTGDMCHAGHSDQINGILAAAPPTTS